MVDELWRRPPRNVLRKYEIEKGEKLYTVWLQYEVNYNFVVEDGNIYFTQCYETIFFNSAYSDNGVT